MKKFLFFISLFLFSISFVSADTTIDSKDLFTIGGRRWSTGSTDFSNITTYDTSYLQNPFNFGGAIYTPPSTYEYINFSYFEHNTSVYNPCNGDDFTSRFTIKLSNYSLIAYVSSIYWNNSACATTYNYFDGTIDVVCSPPASTNNYTDIYINWLNYDGNSTTNISLSRTMTISCGLNTGALIDNQNQNTQSIIDNQNQNTQDIIDSQKVCETIDKSNATSNKYIDYNGVEQSVSGTWGATDFIKINDKSEITSTNIVSWNTSTSTCFYNTNKIKISCIYTNNIPNGPLTIPQNAEYIRMTIDMTNNSPQYKICKNGSQATTDAIDGLNDSLTDDSSIDMSSIGNTAGWLPAGPIDSIINLPLNFFNSISSALSGVCQPLTITLPYVNKTITIPCLSTIFGQITGLTTFWNWVGRIASVYILYRYLLALWDYYDRLTTLQVNFRDDFGGGV